MSIMTNEVANPGSPGTYRRLSATQDLLCNEIDTLKPSPCILHQEIMPTNDYLNNELDCKENNNRKKLSRGSNSLKLTSISHDILRRAFSGDKQSQVQVENSKNIVSSSGPAAAQTTGAVKADGVVKAGVKAPPIQSLTSSSSSQQQSGKDSVLNLRHQVHHNSRRPSKDVKETGGASLSSIIISKGCLLAEKMSLMANTNGDNNGTNHATAVGWSNSRDDYELGEVIGKHAFSCH